MTPDEFIKRFVNHFGAPQAADLKGLKADYVAALSGANAEILQQASDRLIRTHQFRNWPTIAECLAMITTVANDRARLLQRNTPPLVRELEPTAEQRARVRALVDEATAKLRRVAP